MEHTLESFKIDIHNNSSKWFSDLFTIMFEDVNESTPYEERIKIFEENIKVLEDRIRLTYNRDKDNMTHIERFFIEEILDRSSKGSLFSEIIYLMGGNMNFNSYVHYQLPGLMAYSSILKGDNRFLNAFSKDYLEKVETGEVPEGRMKYVLRKLGFLACVIKHDNEGTPGVILNEYMADQFAYAFTDSSELGFDFNNIASSIKSRMLISRLRPIFIDILEYFKGRNLAENTDKEVVLTRKPSI